MTTVATLPAGTIVQYRKVGLARVVECTYPYGQSSRYVLDFITGPRKYRDAGPTNGYWVGANDVVEAVAS